VATRAQALDLQRLSGNNGLEEQADATGNEAVEDALEDRAENVGDVGEDTAEAADDNDDARIENQVAPILNRM
jgi:hypothetical protein